MARFGTHVLSASTPSVTLKRYPQISLAKCNVSLRGEKALKIIVIPNRIPYHSKLLEEYHSEGSFAREKDTSRHTPFENCIDVYTRQKWSRRLQDDSNECHNCETSTVNTRYRHTRYKHNRVIGTKFRVYQLSPVKTSSLWALAHLVTGTQKTILCL